MNTLTMAQAKKYAKRLIEMGMHEVCIVQNMNNGTIVLTWENRCWKHRYVDSAEQWNEMLRLGEVE